MLFRSKDASVAALLLAELAAAAKAAGESLHDRLDRLFLAHGCHAERQVSVTLPGAAGMERMRSIMAGLRAAPPERVAGLEVLRVRDYAALTVARAGGPPGPFPGPAHVAKKGDLVMFDLAGVPESPAAGSENPFPILSNCVAARPSGTEPKIKFYLFAAEPPCSAAALSASKARLAARLDLMERELATLVGTSGG